MTDKEVTTLVFKPPKRVPIWNSPVKSYASVEDPAQTPPEGSDSPGSLRLMSNTGASGGTKPTPGIPLVNTAQPPKVEQPELHLRSHRPARPHSPC